MRKLEVIRCKGYSVMPDEEVLRVKLETLQRELDRPTQFKGRTEELASLIGVIKDSKLFHQQSYKVIDPAQLQKTTHVLEEKQRGLTYLVEIVKQDLQEIEIMMKGYKERGLDQDF